MSGKAAVPRVSGWAPAPYFSPSLTLRTRSHLAVERPDPDNAEHTANYYPVWQISPAEPAARNRSKMNMAGRQRGQVLLTIYSQSFISTQYALFSSRNGAITSHVSHFRGPL